MTPPAVGPLIGVLALQGGVDPHVRALEAVGARTRRVRRASELVGLDGIVFPGGESTTILRLLDAFDLRAALMERLAAGLAAYGSCAGLVVLAAAVLDGRDDQVPLQAIDASARRNAFGRQRESFERQIDFAGLTGGPVRATFIRAPRLEQLGPGVEVLAAVDGSAVAARQHRVLVTAFHPEVSTDLRVHRLFLEMVAEPHPESGDLCAPSVDLHHPGAAGAGRAG